MNQKTEIHSHLLRSKREFLRYLRHCNCGFVRIMIIVISIVNRLHLLKFCNLCLYFYETFSTFHRVAQSTPKCNRTVLANGRFHSHVHENLLILTLNCGFVVCKNTFARSNRHSYSFIYILFLSENFPFEK